jgi:hypothetical protein
VIDLDRAIALQAARLSIQHGIAMADGVMLPGLDILGGNDDTQRAACPDTNEISHTQPYLAPENQCCSKPLCGHVDLAHGGQSRPILEKAMAGKKTLSDCKRGPSAKSATTPVRKAPAKKKWSAAVMPPREV